MDLPILYLVIPCYNEAKVLPQTHPLFLNKIRNLIQAAKISPLSQIMYVDDGSKDKTWDLIEGFSMENHHTHGISQSRNRGHQNAIFAGMMEAREQADIVITIDCDGQDDINCIDQMVAAYQNGSDIVYGVRSNRKSDTWFKRSSAQLFYKLMAFLGADTIYNHADYRLLSKRVLNELSNYKEVNLYLRGLIPLIGFNYSVVEYERYERMEGESHYPLSKMLTLAFDGITSLSIKPIRLVTLMGAFATLLSLLLIIWVFYGYWTDNTVAGWASTYIVVCFMGGIQLLSIGVIGEYIGKIYLEVKARPKYIIAKRTQKEEI